MQLCTFHTPAAAVQRLRASEKRRMRQTARLCIRAHLKGIGDNEDEADSTFVQLGGSAGRVMIRQAGCDIAGQAVIWSGMMRSGSLHDMVRQDVIWSSSLASGWNGYRGQGVWLVSLPKAAVLLPCVLLLASILQSAPRKGIREFRLLQALAQLCALGLKVFQKAAEYHQGPRQSCRQIQMFWRRRKPKTSTAH
eukprot:874647-Pelagomonas_calceolata.AAC.1